MQAGDCYYFVGRIRFVMVWENFQSWGTLSKLLRDCSKAKYYYYYYLFAWLQEFQPTSQSSQNIHERKFEIIKTDHIDIAVLRSNRREKHKTANCYY